MPSLASIIDVDHAIKSLGRWMVGRGYTACAISGAMAYVQAHGELLGASPEYLEPDDLEQATDAFIAALPPVPQSSNEWDGFGRWTPNDVVLAIPPELEDFDGPDAPDEHITRAPGYAESLASDGITLLPVSGGAPFVPSEEDWADYHRHFDAVDDQVEPECRYGYE